MTVYFTILIIFNDDFGVFFTDGRSALWACHDAAKKKGKSTAEERDAEAKLRSDALAKIGLITCMPTMHVLNVGEEACEPGEFNVSFYRMTEDFTL